MSENTVKKLPTYHAIILASSEVGRINLYKLVSLSHLKYYNRRPRVPKVCLSSIGRDLLSAVPVKPESCTRRC